MWSEKYILAKKTTKGIFKNVSIWFKVDFPSFFFKTQSVREHGRVLEDILKLQV